MPELYGVPQDWQLVYGDGPPLLVLPDGKPLVQIVATSPTGGFDGELARYLQAFPQMLYATMLTFNASMALGGCPFCERLPRRVATHQCPQPAVFAALEIAGIIRPRQRSVPLGHS